MQAIVAVDKKWGIGKNNALMFSIPEDMKFFRTTTSGKTVVMGAKTLKSFPNGAPLKNRVNIVFSPHGCRRADCTVVFSFEELKEELRKYDTDDIFIIGGAMFYKTMLPYCKKALVTKVDADGGADAFFTDLDKLENWICTEESEKIFTGGYDIKFTTYENLSPLVF